MLAQSVKAGLIGIVAVLALGTTAQDAPATWSAQRSELTYIVTDYDRTTSGHAQWRVVATQPALPRPQLPSQWGYRLFQGWRPRP